VPRTELVLSMWEFHPLLLELIKIYLGEISHIHNYTVGP
jgi:hypothetical protein